MTDDPFDIPPFLRRPFDRAAHDALRAQRPPSGERKIRMPTREEIEASALARQRVPLDEREEEAFAVKQYLRDKQAHEFYERRDAERAELKAVRERAELAHRERRRARRRTA